MGRPAAGRLALSVVLLLGLVLTVAPAPATPPAGRPGLPAGPAGYAAAGSATGADSAAGARSPRGAHNPVGAQAPVQAVIATPAAAAPVMAARQFLVRLSAGDVPGLLPLLAPATPDETGTDVQSATAPSTRMMPATAPTWLQHLAALRPSADHLGALPAPALLAPDPPAPGAVVPVVARVAYRPNGTPAVRQGWLFMQLAWQPGPPGAWRVADVTGPVTPEGGLESPDLGWSAGAGREPIATPPAPAVLWAPRRPEPPLVAAMERLQERFPDVTVGLVLDPRSPREWVQSPPALGWAGSVWRARRPVEGVPVWQVQPYLGAAGLLIDAGGRAVAPLGALDPARYGLEATAAPWVADLVLAAYGLSSGD